MINEGKFGVQETVAVATIATSTKIFFTSPSWLTNFVGTAGWQTTTISCLTSIAAFVLIAALLGRFPGKNIIEIYNLSLGCFIGFIFSFILAAAFLHESAILVREFAEVMKVYIYPETPVELIAGMLVTAGAVVSFLGLETIVRVAKLSAYALLFLYAILLLLSSQNYKLTNLFPFWGYGLDRTITHGLVRSSAYEEVLIIAVFAGSLQGIKNIRRAGLISLIFSLAIIGLGLFCITLAFPITTLQELVSPVYILARGIKYGSFFQRLDSLFLFLWIFASLIALSILFYCSSSCYCKIFRLQDMRPVIPPMSVILYAVAFIPSDFSRLIQGDVHNLREYSWIIFYAMPVIALIVSILRKKRGTA